MPIKPSHTLLAALALVAAPAFAQDTASDAAEETAAPAAEAAATDAPAAQEAAEAPAEAQAEPTTEETATGEADAPAATADSDEPQTGSYYVKSSHTDWTLRCIRAAQGSDPCELYQLMKDSDGNSVAEVTLIPLQNGNVAAGATIVAPLETDLIKGLGFSIDSSKEQEYPFSFCAPVGCVARVGFTAAELNALKGGNKANLSLMPFGGDPKNPVRLELSLAGFTAAFSELSDYAAEARSASQ